MSEETSTRPREDSSPNRWSHDHPEIKAPPTLTSSYCHCSGIHVRIPGSQTTINLQKESINNQKTRLTLGAAIFRPLFHIGAGTSDRVGVKPEHTVGSTLKIWTKSEASFKYNRERFKTNPCTFCFNLNMKQAKLRTTQWITSYCTRAKLVNKDKKILMLLICIWNLFFTG